jgi:type 2 lantibiotic biosynthesis protein LanM
VLFLAYLGQESGDARFTHLARAGLTRLQRQRDAGLAPLASIGAFSGWGGLLYVFSHLGVMWLAPDLLEAGHQVVETLGSLVESDAELDVATGAAGAIGALLVLQRCSPSAHVLATAIRCGDRLLETAREMPGGGLAWPTPSTQDVPLAGFAHGAGGVAWALLHLAQATGDQRFARAARAGLAYEQSVFSPTLHNWRDLRPQPAGGDPKAMVAWCHGAAGIGLGRLSALTVIDNAPIRTDISEALRTTLARGFGGSHGLCHGDAGNLDLFVTAAGALNEPQWDQVARGQAGALLDRVGRAGGWLCSTPLGIESPGLMTGLAGIGYALLRVAHPAAVPSVLTLAPPPGT